MPFGKVDPVQAAPLDRPFPVWHFSYILYMIDLIIGKSP